MKKLIILSIGLTAILSACNNNKAAKETEDQKISEQAIQIHDEIMPQISVFDHTTVKIDSILTNLAGIKAAHPAIDTTNTRTELSELKTKLEDATDNMMTWMKDYDAVNEDKAYQQKMYDRVVEMKKQFEDAQAGIGKSLAVFK
ncbi:hypothetical protein GCM10022216_33830 [Sphingobacterium kyonggiense]|uniref:Transposase n=1 Tax=Sphingobacterium kyonggiense TaxID=714075 RepID=A0ABP7Z5D9_9SPHI